MPDERMSRWEKGAEKTMVTRRSFEDQAGLMNLSPEDLRGKVILVLGPGKNFEFEKGAAEAGAELVVPLAFSYEKHEDLVKVSRQWPASSQ